MRRGSRGAEKRKGITQRRRGETEDAEEISVFSVPSVAFSFKRWIFFCVICEIGGLLFHSARVSVTNSLSKRATKRTVGMARL